PERQCVAHGVIKDDNPIDYLIRTLYQGWISHFNCQRLAQPLPQPKPAGPRRAPIACAAAVSADPWGRRAPPNRIGIGCVKLVVRRTTRRPRRLRATAAEQSSGNSSSAKDGLNFSHWGRPCPSPTILIPTR